MNVDEMIALKLVHSLHTTQRRSFRGCRRRHKWIFEDGYYPYIMAKPLEFGIAYHKAMEVLYAPITWHDREVATALALKAFRDSVEAQYKNYLKAAKYSTLDANARADYDERIQLGLGMIKHYAKYVSPIEDAGWTPIKIEIEFEVPIQDEVGGYLWCKCDRCWKKWKASEQFKADWAKCQKEHYNSIDASPEDDYKEIDWQGLPVTFGGRIDAIFKDREGRIWIVDWKTAARLSTGEPGAPDDYLWLEDQITGYCWALWKIGIPVAGFIYAETKKAVPEPPEPNKVRRKGVLFSVNKQQSTSYEMYLATVKENDPGAYEMGLYDDFLEYLKSPKAPKFHLRHEVGRTEYELREAEKNLWLEASDIIDPNLRVYPNSGRFGCRGCAFWEPCLGMNRGEDYQYTLDTLFEKRTKHYYETSEPTTEKDE